MILDVPLYNQRDPRWKNTFLGFSDVSTLGLYGCLIACLAMIARYFGADTDPERINDDLKDVDGFQNKVYYKWGRLTRLYQNIKFSKFVNTPDPVTPEQFQEMDDHIDRGMPVMLKIDFNPATTFVNQHYVLLIGKEGNSYKIADPWTGTVERLSSYGVAKYTIQRYILYEGTVTDNSEEITFRQFIDNDITPEVEGHFNLKDHEWYNKHWKGQEMLEHLIATADLAASYLDGMNTLQSTVSRQARELVLFHEQVNSLSDKITSLRVELETARAKLNTCIKQAGEGVKNVDKATKESLKELGRVLLFALVSFAFAKVSSLPETQTTLVGLALLRFADKFLHELGKETGNEKLVPGLSRF